jgi:ABC-type glutathione transport system ATPase component
MTQSIVELDNVRLSYGRGRFSGRSRVEAVKGVSLAIAGGETLGLVGESGSGKTSLGRLCLGLLRPTQGEVRFEGRPFAGRAARRGKLAVVLQHPEWALNPRLRCGVSVAEPLVIQRWGDGATRRDRTAAMLAQVGLGPELTRRYPSELSGGQRQRMAIARALITEPRFIVFDEAVSALDVSVQAQVLNLIRELQRRHGFGALFISHDIAATRYVAHRIAVMRQGQLVEVAPARSFYGQPEHPYSRELLAWIG